ncbi:MAG: hypothetical protein GY856_32185 [bacterium]|nr:hypothetical protein [bacterium]
MFDNSPFFIGSGQERPQGSYSTLMGPILGMPKKQRDSRRIIDAYRQTPMPQRQLPFAVAETANGVEGVKNILRP